MLNNLGMFAYFDGRWDDAIALYRRARAMRRARRSPADVAFTDCNIGEILSDQGRLEEAGSTWSGRAGLERDGRAAVRRLRRRAPGAARGAPRRFGRRGGARCSRRRMAELARVRHRRLCGFRAGAASPKPRRWVGDSGARARRRRRALKADEPQRSAAQRVAGIALARLGLPRRRAGRADRRAGHGARACRGLRHRGDDRRSATRWAPPTRTMRRERDEILGRLKIIRRPTPDSHDRGVAGRRRPLRRVPTGRRTPGSGSS